MPYARLTEPVAGRPFRITVGLTEGYGAGDEFGIRRHHVDEIVDVLLDWMRGRGKRGEPYLTGTVNETNVLYAFPETFPARPGTPHVSVSEPAAVFSGDVGVLYNRDLGDDEVAFLLDSAAACVGAVTRQVRVYVEYAGTAWVVQAEGETSPGSES